MNIQNRDQFPDLLNHLGLTGAGVEVGVLRGDYSAVILEKWKGSKIYLVDSWRHHGGLRDVNNPSERDHELNYRRTVARFRGNKRVEVCRNTSLGASRYVPNGLDFVYLDADRRRGSVLADLAHWWPKVKAGGVMAGHDYVDGDLPEGEFGVRSAVDSFFELVRLPANVTPEQLWATWYVFKPKE